MDDDAAVDLVGRFFAELSRGDLSAIDRHTAPDVVYVIYGEDAGIGAAIPWGGRHEGHAALHAAFTAIFAGLEVVAFSTSLLVAQGDAVMAIGSYTARARATGRAFTTPWVQRVRVTGGRIVDCLTLEDSRAVAVALAGARNAGSW